MVLKVYGLKNCDSCRKALRSLDEAGIDYRFSDIRQASPDSQTLTAWAASVGWESLVNKRSTTWRGLSDDLKTDLDQDKAIDLLVANPTLIKRPVIDKNGSITVGWTDRIIEEVAG